MAVYGIAFSGRHSYRRSTAGDKYHLKQNILEKVAGRIFSYNQTAQFFGVFLGSVCGGQIASHFGITTIFITTSILLFINVIGVRKFVYKQAEENFILHNKSGV